MSRILICDDDKDIAGALEIFLQGAGYETVTVYRGADALKKVEEGGIDLVLMDIMMPGMDGIQATKKLRAANNLPIIMITAKSEDTDKILGLTVGADDYITKPFNPMEVIARIRSQLRRYTDLGGAQKTEDELKVGPIRMDDRTKTVTVDGEPVALTKLEYSILRLLMQHPGQVFSSAQIYEEVWSDPYMGSDNIVAVHIRHLREKLEITPAEPRWLKVVWGLGYKLEADTRS